MCPVTRIRRGLTEIRVGPIEERGRALHVVTVGSPVAVHGPSNGLRWCCQFRVILERAGGDCAREGGPDGFRFTSCGSGAIVEVAFVVQ